MSVEALWRRGKGLFFSLREKPFSRLEMQEEEEEEEEGSFEEEEGGGGGKVCDKQNGL